MYTLLVRVTSVFWPHILDMNLHSAASQRDWDLVTVEAIWVQWTHVQESSSRWREFCDMVQYPDVSSHQEMGTLFIRGWTLSATLLKQAVTFNILLQTLVLMRGYLSCSSLSISSKQSGDSQTSDTQKAFLKSQNCSSLDISFSSLCKTNVGKILSSPFWCSFGRLDRMYTHKRINLLLCDCD